MLLVRIALTLAGGLVALTVVKSVFDQQSGSHHAGAPRAKSLALPRHHNRLAAYYHVSAN